MAMPDDNGTESANSLGGLVEHSLQVLRNQPRKTRIVGLNCSSGGHFRTHTLYYPLNFAVIYITNNGRNTSLIEFGLVKLGE